MASPVRRAQVTQVNIVQVRGYINPMAYNPNWDRVFGYWICIVCKQNFLLNRAVDHISVCTLSGKKRGKEPSSDPNMAYAFGPEESGEYSPFGKENLDRIKEVVKRQDALQRANNKKKEDSKRR